MLSRITTIARYTLVEALHARLPLLVAGALLLLAAVSLFARELAITEGARFQAGIYASGMRLAGVFIAGFYVLASLAREFDDKGLDMVLALDLPRAHYVLGKLAGFLAIGVLVAAAAAAPLALGAPAEAVLQWGLSLAVEISIVIGFAVFCIVSLGHLTLAASLTLGFYVLARTLTAARLMGANPIAGADGLAHQVTHWTTEALALVIPAFDGYTRTEWLLGDPPRWIDIGALAGHGVLYLTLLAAAAMFDFYRRDF